MNVRLGSVGKASNDAFPIGRFKKHLSRDIDSHLCMLDPFDIERTPDFFQIFWVCGNCRQEAFLIAYFFLIYIMAQILPVSPHPTSNAKKGSKIAISSLCISWRYHIMAFRNRKRKLNLIFWIDFKVRDFFPTFALSIGKMAFLD